MTAEIEKQARITADESGLLQDCENKAGDGAVERAMTRADIRRLASLDRRGLKGFSATEAAIGRTYCPNHVECVKNTRLWVDVARVLNEMRREAAGR